MCYETGYYETLLLEEILQDLTTDSDCDNSQSNKDEICDNSQSDKDDNSQSDANEDRVVCGLIYPDEGGFWIGCDGCNDWFDLKVYTNIKSKKHVPDE